MSKFNGLWVSLLFFGLPIYLQAQPQSACKALIVRAVDSMGHQNYRAAIEILTTAKEDADKNNWPTERFLANNNLGLVFFYLNDFGTALQFYLEAYTLTLESADPLDEMAVLNNIAIAYSLKENYEKAEEYFQKAYEIAKKHQIHNKVGYYANNLGGTAFDRGDTHVAEQYFQEALPLLKKERRTRLSAELGLAQVAARLGDFRGAIAALDTLLLIAERADFGREKNKMLNALAQIHLDAGNTDQAIHFARRLRQESPDLNRQLEALKILSDGFRKKKAFSEALIVQDSVLIWTDSLHEIQNGQLFEQNKLRFELQQSQNDFAVQRAQYEGRQRVLFAVAALFLSLVVFAFWGSRKRAQTALQQQTIANNQLKIKELQIEKQKAEQHALETEIETRNRQLAARALAQAGRNELISEIVAALEHSPELPPESPISRHVRSLKKHLTASDDWEEFARAFDEANPRFATALHARHPDLSTSDVRFLSLVLMNLPSKEIAALLNISQEACRKRKERVCQKMDISSGENLSLYLQAFN